MDLVSQTLHVKIIARSCLGEIFRLDASLTLKLDSAAVTGAGGGGVSGLEPSGSWRCSCDALLVASMIVWRDLNPAVAGEGNSSPRDEGAGGCERTPARRRRSRGSIRAAAMASAQEKGENGSSGCFVNVRVCFF